MVFLQLERLPLLQLLPLDTIISSPTPIPTPEPMTQCISPVTQWTPKGQGLII